MQQQEEHKQILDKFGRPYPPRQPDGYIQPGLATDAIVLRNKKSEILLITRGRGAHVGKLAFPGGKLDYGESPEDGCLRELREETNLKDAKIVKLVDVCGEPKRDPRKHMISIVYEVEVPEDAEFVAGDDAVEARFYDLKDLLTDKERFAFDHFEILSKFAGKEGLV